MGKVGLITVHGMGETKRGYADKLFEELQDRLDADSWSNVITGTVYYQHIIQHNQEGYLARTRDKLDWQKLRKFMLYGFSDASSLESYKKGKDSPYYLSQLEILNSLQAIYRTAGSAIPVIVVAQSLGGQVITNYLWDATQDSSDLSAGIWKKPPNLGEDEEKFCRGRNIVRLFTTGCNIPLFLAGRGRDQIKPIDPSNFGEGFQWHNYYDEDDVLGWPLRELSDEYARLVQDHKIDSGGVFTSPTPLSHTRYWTDRDFVKPLAATLKGFMS